MLGQPRLVSVLDETGTPESGYETHGPYHCEDCIHKTAMDEPFCIHPRVVGDSRLQDKLVQIDGRPAIKIDMEHGCCRYVNQPGCSCDGDHDADDV
jgi:hypothetical protein